MRFAADRRTIAFILGHFALVAAAWNVWPHVNKPVAALIVVVVAISAWIQAVITHNTVHAPIWKSHRANMLTQIALSMTYGFPVSEFIPGHNMSHHRYLQTPRDLMRTSKLRYRWNLLNVVLFFAHIGAGVTIGNAQYIKEMGTTKKKWLQQLRTELVITWAFKITILLIDWKRGIFLFLIPAFYAVWGITSINYLQHDGCDENHPYNHSRNFMGYVLNWFTFNNGFHGIHHDHPGLHWSLLREAHMKEIHGRIDPALEQKSIVAYAFRAYLWPGKRLTFDGKPVVLPPPAADEPWFGLNAPITEDVVESTAR